jgi:arylsulfatase A-like enzyme
MEKLGDKRFFLWVHYRDPHTPYLVPDDYKDLFTSDALSDANGHRELPVTASGLAGILKGYLGTMPPTAVVHDSHDMDFLIAQYDAEIRFNDDSVGQLFDKMTELRLWDNTLVVFSADHGEGLGEHEYFFAHGRDTYENQAHVPLVFRHPRLPAGVHVPQTVSLVDVFPTILDLLGLSPAPHMQGKSFAPLVLGQKHEGLRPHHYVMGAWRWGYQTHAVTTDTHKLVMTVDERWVALDAVVDLAASLWLPEEIFNVYHYRRTTREFYDLTTDPGEQKNIYGQHPEIEQALSRSLWSWIDATYAEGRNRDAVNPEMDPETVKALKSLGYLN